MKIDQTTPADLDHHGVAGVPLCLNHRTSWSIARMFALGASLLIAHSVMGQQQALDSLVKKFNAYRVAATTEKIYAHTDQNLTLTGETMWFKLYVVNASSHEPSQMSKVAYVEVLDNVNHAVLQTKIALKEGAGSGSLFIPASL